MNSSLAERFLDTCVSDLLEGIADKFDSIECGASLNPYSIKNPREKRLKVEKSTPMIHIN